MRAANFVIEMPKNEVAQHFKTLDPMNCFLHFADFCVSGGRNLVVVN
jgi:hypothetical protein